MSGLEALQSVQFISTNGKRFTVVDANVWEALIESLEEVEDNDVVKRSLTELRQAGGDHAKAGWKSWDEVQTELE